MNRQKQYPVQLSTKAAELIGGDPKMVRLCQNLGIAFGFGDITIAQLCEHNGISQPFFISLCNMVKSPNFIPDLTEFTVDDISMAIKYLKSSHEEYRKKSLPQLHANVHKIAGMCPDDIQAVVNRFFDDYDAEMNRHIEQEEAEEFAHIEGLLDGNLQAGVSVEDFMETHDDVEMKLEDFKNILIKYVPQSCNIPERYFAVIQIMHIADSLNFHAMIEERILYPLASNLEKNMI